MQRPNLIVTKEVTSLGAPVTQDGTGLLVISAPDTYRNAVTAQAFVSLRDAEAAGITEENDLDPAFGDSTLVWEHVKDFFALANGTMLHVVLVPDTTTFTQLFTVGDTANDSVQAYLQNEEGNIKLIGAALNPTAAEANAGSITQDLEDAIPLAHTFANAEFDRSRPVDIILENRNFNGTAAAAFDLRSLASGNVMVVSGRDASRRAQLIADGHSDVGVVPRFAAVGLALGKAASIQVNQNMGRLTIPPIFQTKDNLPVQSAEFSGGQSLNSFNEANLNVLHDKAYTFIDRYAGYAGLYFVNDNTCEEAGTSNSRLSLNRVVNKAARITRATFLNFLKSTIQVDSTTGQLLPAVVERFKDVITRAITEGMLAQPDPTLLPEISSVQITIDPAQDVLSSQKIVVNQAIIPTGSVDVIESIISLENPN